MKYAVYVEGHSELLFVADVLQKYSEFNPNVCGFSCINLEADKYGILNNPKQGDDHSLNYYQIVNVNNDNRVISKLKKDIPGLLKQSFSVIIGLKDVFSCSYSQINNNQSIINRERIEQLHKLQAGTITQDSSIDCRLHFAIMEYEAWMLALIDQYVKSKNKDMADICAQLNIDITSIDPETSIFHPYPTAQKVFQACGSDYHKHGKESFSFLSTLTRDDYEKLRLSGRCASFAKFLDSLLGGACPALP